MPEWERTKTCKSELVDPLQVVAKILNEASMLMLVRDNGPWSAERFDG